MPLSAWQGVRRLLVACPGNRIDAGMLSPALPYLQQALPESAIALLVSPPDQVTSVPGIDLLLCYPAVSSTDTVPDLIAAIRPYRFDAAIFFTVPWQSPYPLAYACYLAAIPLRLGQSQEFGGSLLTDWVKPPEQAQPNPYLFLLQGFTGASTGMSQKF